MSDHNITILKGKMPFKLEDKKTTYQTLNNIVVSQNLESIKNKIRENNVFDRNVKINLNDPRTMKERRKNEECTSIDGFENYQKMKEQANKQFSEFMKGERKKMSAVITNGSIDKAAWVKIDRLLNAKSGSKIYT